LWALRRPFAGKKIKSAGKSRSTKQHWTDCWSTETLFENLLTTKDTKEHKGKANHIKTGALKGRYKLEASS
jgi:hypothetical protein